jgi:hypothetical protein
MDKKRTVRPMLVHIALAVIAFFVFTAFFFGGARAAGWTIIIIGASLLVAATLYVIWGVWGPDALHEVIQRFLMAFGAFVAYQLLQALLFAIGHSPVVARIVFIGGPIALWIWVPESRPIAPVAGIFLAFQILGWLVTRWANLRGWRSGPGTPIATPPVSIARLAAPPETILSD